MDKKINSKEIAKLAGVARSTVSKVINDYPDIPQETKEKVMNVIKQYNYVPNVSAQMLAGKSSKIIGLVIVDVANAKLKNKIIASPYFSSIVSSVIDGAKQFGYHVLVMEITKAGEMTSLEELVRSKMVSGAIFTGVEKGSDIIKILTESSFKMVILDQKNDGHEKVMNTIYINPDNENGAYSIMKHLFSKGHREIAHITGGIKKLSAEEKLSAYKKAMKEAGIKVTPEMVQNGGYTEEGGYKACKKILEKTKPTALFCGNDLMAMGAIKAIREAGLKVPEDISVAGFDDTEMTKYINPPLTTVKVSITDMGELAVKKLIEMINSGEKEEIVGNYIIKTEFVERESTGRRARVE